MMRMAKQTSTGHVLKVDEYTFKLILAIQKKINQKTDYEVKYAQIVRKVFAKTDLETIFDIDMSDIELVIAKIKLKNDAPKPDTQQNATQ